MKILVVDDDREIAELLEIYIKIQILIVGTYGLEMQK